MDKFLKKAGLREGYLHTGEVIINYVFGPPNGLPMVFIPGQAATWEEYTFLLPMLVERFQVFAVSLRGHGKSSWTPGQYTFHRLGADMTAFLQGVVKNPAIVAGNSSGGVLVCWLAAYAPEWVKAVVLEDPPLFRCQWPAIKDTWVYDLFLGLSRMAVSGGGGYARFFLKEMVRMAEEAEGVAEVKLPPRPIRKILARWIAVKQACSPGYPVDLPFLPQKVRIMMRSVSQFDGHFSRAFVEGTVGEGFDHETTLAKITQPVLFLHARWLLYRGRLLGAMDDQDVERVRLLIQGPWKYVRMDCGHAIPLEAPALEAREILKWLEEVGF